MLFCVEKDRRTFKIILNGSVEVTRFIHVQPNVQDIYSKVRNQILEKLQDLGLSERIYRMHWQDEDGEFIEIRDNKDMRYVITKVSPDTDKLFVQMDMYTQDGKHVFL